MNVESKQTHVEARVELAHMEVIETLNLVAHRQVGGFNSTLNRNSTSVIFHRQGGGWPHINNDTVCGKNSLEFELPKKLSAARNGCFECKVTEEELAQATEIILSFKTR